MKKTLIALAMLAATTAGAQDYIVHAKYPYDMPIPTLNKTERLSQQIEELALRQETDPVWRAANAMIELVVFTNANSLAEGRDAVAGDHSTVYGKEATATNFGSVAVGYRATTPGDHSVAVGKGATANANESVAINAKTSRFGAVAVGSQTSAGGDKSVAVGYKTTSTGNGSAALGTESESAGGGSVALGCKAKAVGARCIQLGEGVNRGPSTLQFRSFLLVDKNGTIPVERLGRIFIREGKLVLLVVFDGVEYEFTADPQ